VSTNVAIFAVAAFFEIAGCFAFWLWAVAALRL
jgi:drug/metabolite transporter superfamily protein YnfA